MMTEHKEVDVELWKCFNCEQYNSKEESCGLYGKKTPANSSCSFFHLRRIDEEKTLPYEPITSKEYEQKQFRISGAVNLYHDDKIKIAREFYLIQPYFYDKAGMFWLWNFNNNCWKMVDEYDLMNYLIKGSKETGEITKTKFWIEVMRSLKLVGRQKEPLPIKSSWIQFNNEIYDLNNGDRIEATPKYFNVNPIPHELRFGRETPAIDRIFGEWVGEENIKTLKQIIGYCMIPDYPLHRIFCFTGSGLNGKGVFLRLIQKIIGDNNCSSTELDLLMSSRFETGKVYKKLVCQMGETNFNEMSKTSMLKKLSGQDLVGIEFKNKTPFDYTNYAKLMIATNSLPPTMDKTDGFYRRWMIIDFPNKFKEGVDVINMIPEDEYSSLCGQIIDLLPDLLRSGAFFGEGDVSTRRKRYEQKSNPLFEFIDINYKRDVNSKVPIFEFEDNYNSFLTERGLRNTTRKRLSLLLRDNGFDIERENVQKEDGEWTKWSFIYGLDNKYT